MDDIRVATKRGEYTISTAATRLDFDVVHGFLVTSYWSPGVARDVVERAWAASLGFGIFAADDAQVGGGRVVTDRATFAWLCDVFVVEEHRGIGLGKALLAAVTSHPDLATLRKFMLGTRDAHGLYAAYGFEPVEPGRTMVRRGPI